MADLVDLLSGSAGAITGHTADSGQSWGPSGSALKLNGSGSAYCDQAVAGFGFGFSSWTPPAADYSASVVLGQDFVNNAGVGANIACGPLVRGSGAFGAETGYVVQSIAQSAKCQVFQFLSGSPTQVGSDMPVTFALNDLITLAVQGSGSTVTLTVYQNETQVGQVTDSSAGRITGTGSAGIYATQFSGTTVTDIVRAFWAGALGSGPPAITIAPTSPTVALGATQSFALSTAFPGEAFGWSATHGSISGTAATEVYTAPGSGVSDTVTGTSADFPTRTINASVTLTGGAATSYTMTMAQASGGLNGTLPITFQANGTPSPSLVITPADSLSGTFSPTTLTITDSSTHTVNWTPTVTGSHAISATHTGGGFSGDPSSLAVSVLNTVNRLSIAEQCFATGLSTVGYAVYLPDNSLFGPVWATTGVHERGTGSANYGAVADVPASGDSEVRWSVSDAAPFFVDQVQGSTLIDTTQAIPLSNAAHTLGDALNAARAQGFGKWVKSGTTLTLYADDGTTVVRAFTLDSSTAPNSRT